MATMDSAAPEFSKQSVLRDPSTFQTLIRASDDWRQPYARLWADGQQMYVTGTTLGWGNDLSIYDGGVMADRIIVNKAKQLVDSIAAATLMRNPKFKCYPTVQNDMEAAQTAEKYMNQVYTRYNMVPALRTACFDALVKTHGWLKVGWHMEREKLPSGSDAIAAETEQLAREVQQFQLQNPELAGSLPDPRDMVPSVLEGAHGRVDRNARGQGTVTVSHPTAVRVSPFDMFVDPTATSMDNIRWIAERVIRNTEDIRADKKRYTAARKKVQPTDTSNLRMSRYNLKQREDIDSHGVEYSDIPRQTVIWEMYSLEYDTFCVWAEGSDEWLVKPSPLPIYPHPYIYIPLFPVPDRFYPAGVLPHMSRMQEVLSEIATENLIHKRRSTNLIMMWEEAITDEARTAITEGAQNGIVPISSSAQQINQLGDVAQPFPNPELPRDWHIFNQQIEQYIEELTGLEDFLRAAPQTRRSALEASIANDRYSSRAKQLNQTFEDAAKMLARKVLSLAQGRLFVEEPIGVIEGGRVRTHGVDTATRENLASEREFRFEIEVGSMASRDDAVNRHESLELFRLLQPLLGLPDSPINARALIERLLQDQGVSEPEDLLNQPAMPNPTGAMAGPELAGAGLPAQAPAPAAPLL